MAGGAGVAQVGIDDVVENCDLEDRIDDVEVTDLVDDGQPPPPGYPRGDDRTDDVDADATEEEEAGWTSAAVGRREFVMEDDVDDLWDLVELRDEMEAADDGYRGPPDDIVVVVDDARTADAILVLLIWEAGARYSYVIYPISRCRGGRALPKKICHAISISNAMAGRVSS